MSEERITDGEYAYCVQGELFGSLDPEEKWTCWWQEVVRRKVGSNFTVLVLGNKRFPELDTPARVLTSLARFALGQNPDATITFNIYPPGGSLLLRILASWSVVPILEAFDEVYANLNVEIVEEPLDPKPDMVVYFPILDYQQQRIAMVAYDAASAGIPVHTFGWDGHRTIGPLGGPAKLPADEWTQLFAR